MKIIQKMFVLIAFVCLSFGPTILAQASSIEGDLNVIQHSTITGSCGNDLTWSLANGNLMITGVGSMTNYTKEEETPWYSYASDINTVTIGSGVTSIGGHAFYNFDYLTTVNISDTVTDIRGYAFSDCDSLVKIVMPDSVTTMGGYVFEGCDSLAEVKLSNGLTVIPGFTFNQCKCLNVVNIPTQCTAINGRAFAECSALENISFPSALKEIGENAFLNCSKLKNVSFPASLINIGYGAFSNCKSITAITVPDTIEYIGSRAFMECEKLTSVTFEGMLPKMESMIFFKCTQINAVYADSMDDWLKTYFEDRFSNPLFYSNKLYINGTSIGTTLIIPDGVKKLPANAFAGSDITKVVLPDTVEEIGEYCFYNCVNLTSVDMSSSLYDINEGAFANCEKLMSITCPENTKYISQFAFFNCKKLASITFPASIKYISDRAFYNCSSLNKVFFEGNAPSISEVFTLEVGPGAADGAHNLSGTFAKCTFTAYYPQSDTTWTKAVREADYGGEITWIGYEPSLTIPAKPYKIVNTVSGVHVYWNAVSEISKYGLWRSETGKEGSYKWMGNPTTNHFTDTKVTGGKTYFYCVSTCNPNSNAHSVMSEPIGITYVETPDITVRMNLAAGVKLTWNQVDGATGYAIYRKNYDGGDSWVRIATIEGNSTFTYTDTSVATANGKVYRYTIRALAGSNMKTLSGCRNTGRTMTRLTNREVSNVTAVDATSAKCTWTTTVQAAGYEVMFVSEAGDVTTFTIGNYKTGVKTFKGLDSKTTYTVQVRSYKAVVGVGNFYSAWSEEKSVTTP